MAKIPAATFIQFGTSANPASEIGQFGGYVGLDYTNAIATLQSGTAWTRGWYGETINTNRPFIQDMNAIDYVFSYFLAYIQQMGIGEYVAATVYDINSIVQVAGQLYISLVSPNTGNTPATSPTQWQSGIPGMEVSGVIKAFAGLVAPSGYLLCNGQAVSRTTYAALYTICGTSYGAGNGSTTFNVPNLQGQIPVAYLSGDTYFGTVGVTGGEETHTLTVNEMPSHSHGSTFNSHGPNNVGSNGNGQFGNTDNTGGGAAHNNIQPYQTIGSYIIKT